MPIRPLLRRTLPGLVALALSVGASCLAHSPSLAGDPDIPAALTGTSSLAAGPPARSFLRRDFAGLASSRTLRLLGTGGFLAGAALRREDPEDAQEALDQPLFDGGLDLGNTYGHGAVLAGGALALLAAGGLADSPNLRGASGEMFRALAYTGIAVTAIKVGVERTRPNGGAHSFPSGHTAAAFAVAPILSRRFGRAVAIPAYALASATALGRMEDRKHFLSDVLAGGAIGLAVGRAVAGPDENENAASPRFLVGLGGARVMLHF